MVTLAGILDKEGNVFVIRFYGQFLNEKEQDNGK
mgnify:CR=1 FL=1